MKLKVGMKIRVKTLKEHRPKSNVAKNHPGEIIVITRVHEHCCGTSVCTLSQAGIWNDEFDVIETKLDKVLE